MSADQLMVFSYLDAEKAERYRQVMRAFRATKRRFVVHLRPDEVVAALHGDAVDVDRDGVQTLLGQLVEWGNRRADPHTVEEFYRARFLYQFMLEGEAAERAVAHVEDLLLVPGELHRSLTTLTTRLE